MEYSPLARREYPIGVPIPVYPPVNLVILINFDAIDSNYDKIDPAKKEEKKSNQKKRRKKVFIHTCLYINTISLIKPCKQAKN